MRVVIAGSSGFLGTALRHLLATEGHDVVRLVRREPRTADESEWDPYRGSLDQAVVDAADVVVNLAGSPLMGNPHSRKFRTTLHDSRVVTTRVLATALAASSARPAFIAQSASAWYGDHGDEIITERSGTRGDAFMTQVVRDWEAAAAPARDAGVRVCHLRTVPVMHHGSLVFSVLRPVFRLGLGARLGNGRQYFPVISLRDWVGAAAHLMSDATLDGPYNLCSPGPGTNSEFTRALAAALHRPAVVAVPAPLIRVAAGPLSPELLGSYRTVPARLEESGYRFADRDLSGVLAAALG